jgi:hypothetical protein
MKNPEQGFEPVTFALLRVSVDGDKLKLELLKDCKTRPVKETFKFPAGKVGVLIEMPALDPPLAKRYSLSLQEEGGGDLLAQLRSSSSSHYCDDLQIKDQVQDGEGSIGVEGKY